MNEDKNIFPRNLSQREKNWLFCALPENKPGYQAYRKKIEESYVIGKGTFGEGALILGNKNDEPDYEISSAPVFAAGQIVCNNCTVDVIIHEEDEAQIEIDISTIKGNQPPADAVMQNYQTYSEWNPGQKTPYDDTGIREIHLIKDSIVIAIVPNHEKIWVYDKSDGVNHFIPVTNFYSEIIRLREIKDPKIALDPKRIFTRTDEFSDEDIKTGFLSYNKQWNRVKLDNSLFEKKPKKKQSIFNFFKRRS